MSLLQVSGHCASDCYKKKNDLKKKDHKRFTKYKEGYILIMAVYVDDLLISSNDINVLQLEKKSLGERLKLEDEGEILECLLCETEKKYYLRLTNMHFFHLC